MALLFYVNTHISQSLLVFVPDSVRETLNIEALHAILVVFFAVVLLLHLLLLLGVHERCLVVVHLVVHVVLGANTLNWILFIKLVEQLHENLVVVVEPLGLDLLPPGVVVHLHIVQNGIHKHPNVGVLVGKQF
jgi:hypothetical protein